MLKFEEETVSGLNFDLPDDLKMLQNLARDFARNEILPRVEHYDVSGEWPWDLWHKARKIGLVNLNIPEEYGGMGATVLEECIIGEELAYACSGIQTALMLNQLAVLPILVAGNDAQKQKYFPRLTEDGEIMAYCMTEPDAGSDVAGIKTTAVKQGDKYILNGSKTWITDGPVANYFTVYAKTDPSCPTQGHVLLHRRAGLPRRQHQQAPGKDGPARRPGLPGLLRECGSPGGKPAGQRG